MLATVVYYIWRGRNDWLLGEAPRNVLVVYSDIVKCIVSKINHFHNMASSETNRRFYISWGFSGDIFYSS